MKFSIRFADQIVGALVILALAILVIVIFMLGKNQRWFVRDYEFTTYLTSASGISRNMSVQYKGFKIGEIKEIELANKRILMDGTEVDEVCVEVSFTIYKEHGERVKVGSLVEIQSSPIPGLGNAFVFHPGTDSKLLEGKIIPEVNSNEGKSVIESEKSSVAKADDSITNILNQVTGILETVNLALSGPKETKDVPLEQIIQNVNGILSDLRVVTGALSEDLKPLINSLDDIAKMLSDPNGAIRSILNSDGAIYNSLEDVIKSLAGIVKNLEKSSDILPEQLPQIVTIIKELSITVKSVQDVLTSISNNPLLKGGIPENTETGPSSAGSRNENFIRKEN